MTHDYAWQKAYEAVLALTSKRDFDDRLLGAALALSGFPVQGLPTSVAELALVADNAFSSWPDSPDFPAPNGTCEALIQYLPENRKLELREKVIGLFQAICELRGSDAKFDNASVVPDGHELSSPDKWEFLYWIVPSGADEAARHDYVRYAQHWLPNLPAEVLLEWIGRHGKDGMTYWSHLPLERLRFEEVAWTYEELLKVQTIDPSCTDIGPNTGGHLNLHRQGDWQGEYILVNGTWNAPIIVIDHPLVIGVAGSSVPAGLVLIEGHNRIARMLNVPPEYKDGRRHRVMLGHIV